MSYAVVVVEGSLTTFQNDHDERKESIDGQVNIKPCSSDSSVTIVVVSSKPVLTISKPLPPLVDLFRVHNCLFEHRRSWRNFSITNTKARKAALGLRLLFHTSTSRFQQTTPELFVFLCLVDIFHRLGDLVGRRNGNVVEWL